MATHRRAGQRCFGLLALISRTQVRHIHLPERIIFFYGYTQKLKKKIKPNLHYTRFITLDVVPKRGNKWRGPTPQLSVWGNATPKKRRSGGDPLATLWSI